MENLQDKINKNKLPLHIAIIMDGNGRWAKKRNQERIYGHQKGVESVRNVTEACAEVGIKYLTLYTFSKENWNRPQKEIDMLMQMLVTTIKSEEENLMKNNIRFDTIGDTALLAENVSNEINRLKEKTKNNNRMTTILALDYSSRWEITKAVKDIILQVKNNTISVDDITEQTISNNLTTKNYPDPDLIIRTSGEYRISNFLLWQLAYSEFYFTDVLWPDFSKDELYKAIIDFQKRERRFGKTSEQIKF